MIIFSLGERRVLGIDLGSLNIKIIEVIKNKDRFEVSNFGIIPIVNFKEIGSSSYILEENLSLVLKEFFKKTNIKAKEAIFNIQAPYLFPINFFVPLIPEKSLSQVIRFESQKQIPFSLDEIEIEYRYQTFQTESQQKQWLVFMTALPKNYLKKIENICKLINLRLKDSGSEYFNLEPFFFKKLGNIVAFDLGHSYSIVSLFKDGKTIYGNKISIRGYDFLDMLMNLTRFPEDKILDLVYNKGFQFLPEEREIQSVAVQFLDNIANLIKSEIEKIENKFLIKIEKIYWTGGLSILPGFKEGMLARLGLYEQEILQPFEIFQGRKFVNLGDKATLFSQSLGVVFRKLMS